MEEALRALLLSDPTIVGLVGQRIYWNDIPQATAGDLIVLHKISGAPSYTLRGPTSLRGSRVQINTRADKVVDAWAIERAVEAKLSGFRGSQGGVMFAGIFLEDSAELTSEKTGTDLYRGTRSDYSVWSKAA